MAPRSITLVLFAMAAACGSVPARDVKLGTGPPVHQIELPTSNVFLVRSKVPILIDAGSPDDLEDLAEALELLGLELVDVKLAILTHAHGDHAGLAAQYQKAGIRVALGKGDLGMVRRGKNDELVPMNLTARLIRPFIDFEYVPFAPDILLDETGLDLRPFGLAGRAFQMPGHTPGSVVIALDDGGAFAGDLMLGGVFGGAFCPESAGEHYYQTDEAQNLRNLAALLERGVKLFYLGHGGPVTRESAIEGFEDELP